MVCKINTDLCIVYADRQCSSRFFLIIVFAQTRASTFFFTPLISAEDSSNEASVYFSHRHQETFFFNYLIVSGLFAFFLHRTSDLERVCHTCMEVKTYHYHRMHHLTLCHSQVTCCATSVLAQMACHC